MNTITVQESFERSLWLYPQVARLWMLSGDFGESIESTWNYENNEATMDNLNSFLKDKKITKANANTLFEEWSTTHITKRETN